MKQSPDNPKVCAIMCTYGRFEIVKQSLTMFLAQDYPNKQLVIFNTAPTPLKGNDFLKYHPDIKIVNQQHKSNGQPYQSLGDVRNASLEHAEGDIYICWDDDDLFMPWHITQAMAHYNAAPVMAWKPDVSYFSQDGGESYKGLMGNAMEASFVVSMEHIKTHGFSTGRSGAEHVDGGWLDKCEPLVENVSPFESYGYIWGDQRCGHKTSGHINDESNFDNHKTASDDFGSEPLSVLPPHMFDKFFKSALAVWDNPSAYDGMDVQVTVQSIQELKDLMRGVYQRQMVPSPEFLTPLIEPESQGRFARGGEKDDPLSSRLEEFVDVEGSDSWKSLKREWENDVYGFHSTSYLPGDVVVDIGAHVGIMSTLLAKAYPEINIIAYEASPAHAKLCKRNMEHNGVYNVSLNCNAVHSVSGKRITLHQNYESNSGGLSHYKDKWDNEDSTHATTISFDDLVEKHNIKKIKFLKLDCEGGEYEIFYGSKKYFNPEFIEHIGVEFHDNGRLADEGYTAKKMVSELRQRWPEGRVHVTNGTDEHGDIFAAGF